MLPIVSNSSGVCCALITGFRIAQFFESFPAMCGVAKTEDGST